MLPKGSNVYQSVANLVTPLPSFVAVHDSLGVTCQAKRNYVVCLPSGILNPKTSGCPVQCRKDGTIIAGKLKCLHSYKKKS